MRTNLPVTDNSVELSNDKSIVSKTDLKGLITYVNPYFMEVSGFTEDELIGAPQNIVRHPDMPVEAFGDMWRVLKSGLPWTGLVKNRCKNGDYYWVLANVTPIIERGQIVGYMSVRSKPSHEVVAATAALYKKFKDGAAQGLVFTGKGVVRLSRSALDILGSSVFKSTIHQGPSWPDNAKNDRHVENHVRPKNWNHTPRVGDGKNASGHNYCW